MTPYERLQAFFHTFSAFTAEPDIVLIQDHEDPRNILFLEEGIVKQTVITETGKELCLNLYKPGTFFPLMSAIAGIPNHYMFVSVLPCSGWKAPAEELKAFLQSEPEILYDLTSRLLKGLHGMLIKTEQLMQGNAQSLLVQTLLTLHQRFPKTHPQIDHLSTKIEIPLTHQQLAELTGLSRETVTRELLTLKQLGLLVVEQHMVSILKPEELRGLIQHVSQITV